MKESNGTVELAEQDDSGKFRANVGGKVVVRLAENPTTGFRWRLINTGEPVCILEQQAFDPGAKPGESGTHCWRFSVKTPGSAHIELAYGRSWEGDKPPARRFSVHLAAS